MRHKRNSDLIRLWVEPSSREKNDALYPQVVAGDPVARERMIQSNMGLAVSITDRFLVFLPKYRYMSDDLISAGLIGLVEAVNKMQKDGVVEDANPTGLMTFCIQAAIGSAIEHAADVRVPTRTRKRKAKQGVTIQAPVKERTLPLDVDDDDLFFSYDPRAMQELRQTINACCENDMEREIVRLREEGYVDREISERLGLALTTTYVMRRTLYARFLELTGWKGEA